MYGKSIRLRRLFLSARVHSTKWINEVCTEITKIRILQVVRFDKAVMLVRTHQIPLTLQPGTANAEDNRGAFGGPKYGVDWPLSSFGKW